MTSGGASWTMTSKNGRVTYKKFVPTRVAMRFFSAFIEFFAQWSSAWYIK